MFEVYVLFPYADEAGNYVIKVKEWRQLSQLIAASKVRLIDGKKNPVTIQVREFERRPNAEFRRVMGDLQKAKI